MKHKILLVYFFLCVTGALFSQSKVKGDSLLDHANKLYRAQSYDSALVYYDKAIIHFDAQDSVHKALTAQVNKGNTLFRKAQYNKASALFREAIEAYEALPERHIHEIRPIMGLSASLSATGDLREARMLQKKAHQLNLEHYTADHLRVGVSHYNMASGALRHGEYDAGIDHSLQALPIFLREYPDGHRRLSSLYVNLANMYDNIGDHQQAISYYEKANTMDLKLYGPESYLLAYNYINLGITYRQLGEDARAEELFIEADRVARIHELPEIYTSCNYQLGLIAVENGDDGSAESRFQAALGETHQHLGSDFPAINYYYAALAEVAIRKRDFEEAERQLAQALLIVENTFDGHHPQKASIYSIYATNHTEKGDYQEAHIAIDSSISGLFPTGTHPGFSIADLNQSLNLRILLHHVHQKSQIFIRQFEESKEPVHLEEGLLWLVKCDQVIDHMRRNLIGKESKSTLQNRSVQIYEDAIATCKDLYELTGNIDYLNKAFVFSEKNKSTILGENLYARKLSEIDGVPSELLVFERESQLALENLKRQYQESPSDSILLKDLEIQHFRYDSLINAIGNNYPSYFSLKYGLETVDLSDVQVFLDKDQLLLSYFAAGETWYVFGITHDTILLMETSSDLNDELMNYRTYTSTPGMEAASSGSSEIYSELVQPMLEQFSNLNKVIVLPDGLLGHISFEALQTSNTDAESFLIKTHTTSRANSATLLLKGTEDEHTFNTYVGYAPSYGSQTNDLVRSGLNELPLAKEEVRESADIFNGDIYIGDEATEKNFHTNAKKAGILHLAMHALLDDSDPNQSKLIFAPSRDTLFDGHLHSYELYATSLESDLAILSACNTGNGPLQKGEGIMNLSRGFLYAGCPNLVVSLWQARDLSTTMIITGFLENIKNKMGRAEALRMSKLEYLDQADPLMAHPSNWAALVLIGDPGPMKYGFNISWVVLGILPAVLLLLYLFKS